MSAYAVIVALECVTFGLIGFLAFQLFKVAKNNPLKDTLFEEDVPTLTDEVIEVSQAVPEKVVPIAVFKAENEVKEPELKEEIVPADVNSKKAPAADLLNDYIGEFFAEDMAPDLQEMRAPAYERQEENAPSKKVEPQSAQQPETTTDQVAKPEVEDKCVVRPVILNEAERVHEAAQVEDDAIITVASENEVGIVTGNDKTMSGKVVHAMLNEAEIVCAS